MNGSVGSVSAPTVDLGYTNIGNNAKHPGATSGTLEMGGLSTIRANESPQTDQSTDDADTKRSGLGQGTLEGNGING